MSKKKKKKKQLTLGVTALPAQAAEVTTPQQEATAEKIYLSEIPYVKELSNSGNGKIEIDHNVDGKYFWVLKYNHKKTDIL